MLIGSIFCVFSLLCLFGVIHIIYITPPLSLTLLAYGYVYTRLRLEEERLIINSENLSYYRGNIRKLHIPIVDLKSLNFTDSSHGSDIFSPLFIVNLNNNKSVSAPYQLFELYQLLAFKRKAKAFIAEIKTKKIMSE